MALNRKYAALPDLDSAPDIYETPELTDDTSTVLTTFQSQSDQEFDDDDTDAPGISRTKLRIDQARSRFMPSQIDANDVDFSDRVNSKRKSYKATSRRQRVLEDGTEELGDLSDEGEGESLVRKIARLKREIEEAKDEYGKQKSSETDPESQGTGNETELELTSLSQVLEEISKRPENLAQGRTFRSARLATFLTKEPESAESGVLDDAGSAAATYTVTYAPNYEQTHALAKAADFDQRLAFLEKAIGIGSSAMPELDASGLPRAIVPTLDKMQKQVSTLSNASSSSLDTISRKVRQLTQEAEQLEKSRRQAKQAKDALASAGTGSLSPDAVGSEDSDQTTKINALYSTLPTIEGLTPLLSPLLDRLRSLKTIHADAATASETLDKIVKRQTDMALDIKQWREGLEKVEAAISQGETSMGKNTKIVEGWVKALEERMAKLA
ncbi:putative dynactin subunit [Coniella lustricola]|uniref:Putative dynactin subunit n=1 Tax=Coniella lustricola TaxID=2025994 RepID=A0A2T3ABD1_9PEZI|nr:putative dynactin subunit [Coniella lustricola]